MDYKEIDPEKAKALIDSDNDVFLLDVREVQEYNRAHIDGVTLMPLGQLAERHEELNKEQPILCICAGGIRSEKAARFLLSQEFKDVTNMSEGMKGWLQRGFPAESG
jgi:rhodanese-related sulfurtransferase